MNGFDENRDLLCCSLRRSLTLCFHKAQFISYRNRTPFGNLLRTTRTLLERSCEASGIRFSHRLRRASHRFSSNPVTRSITNQRGVTLIEVVIGVAIIALSFVGILIASRQYVVVGLGNTEKLQAAYFAEEGIEIVRALRDRSWNTFAALGTSTTYYLAPVAGVWEATTTPTTTLVGFTRTVALGSVYRNSTSHDIVSATSSNNYLDPLGRFVRVTVSWGGGLQTSAVSYEGGTTDSNLASFPSNNAGDGDPAQSFTTGSESVSAGSVALLLKRVGSPSNVYLEIRSGSTVGVVLGTSGTVASSSIPTSALTWTSFTFSSPVPLAANTTYYLRLRSTPDSTIVFSGSAGTLNWGYLQTAQSPYAGGTAYRYVGRQGNQSDQGQSLTQYDFSFRVITAGGGNTTEVQTYLMRLFNN